MSDRRQVTLTSSRPVLSITAWMGRNPPAITGGYGGWQSRPRPRRQSLTVFQGNEPYQMDLPLMLDGFADDRSVQAQISTLERMGRPVADWEEPPIVTVSGVVPHTDLTWVVNDLKFGDSVRNEKGAIVRQEITVSLLRYVAEDRVSTKSSAAKARANAGGTKKTGTSGPSLHTVRAGETLSSIAADHLGDYRRWPEIASLNGIRDPKVIVVGQPLRIPPR